MPEQNSKWPWGQWRVKQAAEAVSAAEARLEHAKEVLGYVEGTVAENLEHAATRRLEAKKERLQSQLDKTNQTLAEAQA
jgi:hypothetical protein